MATSIETSIQPQLLSLKETLLQSIAESKYSSHLVKLMTEVDKALNKIENGTYGVCELCSDLIEEDYLQRDPLARICFSHFSEEQKASFEKDLELAHHIQNKLLPSRHLNCAGWEISHHYEPLGPVSGDFCDVIVPENEKKDLFFIFGDVSGKGVSAALLMSHLNAIFRSLVDSNIPINKLVEQANRLFNKSTLSTHFATLVCGRASASGEVEICNAGHCRPLLKNSTGITPINSTGLPVGIFYNGEYTVEKFQMKPGETLLLYTDGLTEAKDAAKNEYGEERLSAFLDKKHTHPPRAIISAVLEDVKSFGNRTPPADDLTIMVIRRN
jgi:sigma-B regulation protein RsbU (phosphoserine phosphatase)